MKNLSLLLLVLSCISLQASPEKVSLWKKVIGVLSKVDKQSVVVTMGPCGVYIPLSDVEHKAPYKNQIVRIKSSDQSFQSTAK